MRLRVEHVTIYSYDRPVRGVVQSHRLTPASFEGQRVEDWQVTVSDGQRGGSFRDGAGDRVQAWTVRGPVDSVCVQVQGVVETQDMAGVLRGHRESVPPQAWLRETAATHADAALTALAQDVTAGSALERAHALAARIADAIVWEPGTTDARSTAAEALAQGKGVCQDHAHALIACARVRGLPGRYVTGYMLAGDAMAGQDAAHAWAEIWIEGLGWVGFDPANRCCPDDRYIRLGSGLDAQDAAPIRGTARGGAQESLSVQLAVTRCAEMQQQQQ